MAGTSKSVNLKNESLREYDVAGGDGTFQAVGSPLSNPARLIKLKNNSDKDVTISYDGFTDHDIILSGDREVEDECSNKSSREGAYRPQNTQVWAKSSSGSGKLYVTAIYAD